MAPLSTRAIFSHRIPMPCGIAEIQPLCHAPAVPIRTRSGAFAPAGRADEAHPAAAMRSPLRAFVERLCRMDAAANPFHSL